MKSVIFVDSNSPTNPHYFKERGGPKCLHEAGGEFKWAKKTSFILL